MKKYELIRLLGNLKADFFEKLETDQEFANKEFKYINTDLNLSFLYRNGSGKFEGEYQFNVKYITTSLDQQSFYGFDYYFGHNVYREIDKRLIDKMSILED